MAPQTQTDTSSLIPLRLLIVEDRETDTELIVRELKKHRFNPSWVRVDTEEEFLHQIQAPFDLITADAIMPQFSAKRALALLQERQLDTPCIIVSGSIGEEEAVAMIRAGAVDYLMKDRLGRLGQAIRHVLEQHTLRAEHRKAHHALVTLNAELEERIAERTARLEELNQQLAQELTERKQIELRLRRHEARLERRVAARTKQLERSHIRLRRLVTELTLTEQRERKVLASELHDYLAQLLVVSKFKVDQLRRTTSNKNADRLLGETESALDQALTYSRTLIARLSPTVLFSHGLIAALKWLTEYFSKQGLGVEVQSHVETITIPEDYSVLVFQSVRELLFNVLKHAGTAAATVEAFAPDQGYFRITVVDNGKGFDMRTLRSTTKGYGLFSIQERIEGLGGTFTVNSSPGSGTRIELLVPTPNLIEVRDDSIKAPGTVDTPPDSPTLCRVMIVDDHALIRQELAKLLMAIEGVIVVGEARNGDEGVRLARTLRPELILMDVNMPGIDGIEATKQILAQHPQIQIIGITVNADTEIHARMIAAGAVVSLNKNTLSRELQPTLSRILHRRAASISS
ncbi:MAG: response regulator [Nitrospira sp.]|nr:response regulator [Nitrospira sp.]